MLLYDRLWPGWASEGHISLPACLSPLLDSQVRGPCLLGAATLQWSPWSWSLTPSVALLRLHTGPVYCDHQLSCSELPLILKSFSREEID